MMDYILTCPRNLESLVAKEVKALWYKQTQTNKWFVAFGGDMQAIAKINLRSRIWSKLFLRIWHFPRSSNFNELFENVYKIKRKNYIDRKRPFVVNVVNKWTWLTSIPTCQKIIKKSIAKNLLNWKEGFVDENSAKKPLEIFVIIEKSHTRIMINTTWDWLFKRSYKLNSSSAWLKENVAAGLITLAGWRFNTPFIDLFCGAWTLPIEATMIAKNIPPGLNRNFDFEEFDWYDKSILKKMKDNAKQNIFTNKKYEIFGYDIDSKIIETAKENAKNAWVEKNIIFEQKNFLEIDCKKIKWTVLTNPPYGIRLKSNDIKKIYEKLIYCFKKNSNINWWFYTTFEIPFSKNIPFKKKLIYNWQQEAYFHKKISNL